MGEWKRICPQCTNEISYNRYISHYMANKNNSNCMSCRNQNLKGIGNPFYGKTHSLEVKQKIANGDKSHTQTLEFRKKISDIYNDNPNWMSKMTLYEKWIEMYGKEEADIKMIALKEKHSKNSSGDKNPMFGKTTPKKAGNGWNGWYNDFFFRSLRELSYIVNVLEPSGKKWESAEKIRIPYINYDGNKRTYSPDFITENKLIEIKPQRLIDSPLVKLKVRAAKEYCKENGLIFEILDVDIISINEIQKLIDTNKVILTDKTKERYKTWTG